MASNIVFDGTKGISLPSFTTTEKNAIVSPATGAVVYDSTLKQESLYNGSAWVNVNASGNSAITSGTAVTASGTAVDFTGIPSWVKRVTIMISGLSGNGSSSWLFQIGDSGGIEVTGYLGGGSIIGTSAVASTGFTAGYGFDGGSTSAKVWQGAIRITNITGNTWVADGVFGRSDSAGTATVAGSKTLSDVLTQVRITHANGTDTFDAGTINILYE